MRIKSILFPLILCTSQLLYASDFLLTYVTEIEKQINYAEKNQGKVWPGFHPASMPSLLIFEPSNEASLTSPTLSGYALNFQPAELPWQKIDSGQSIYYLDDMQTLKMFINKVDTFTDVDGSMSYIFAAQEDELKEEVAQHNPFMEMRSRNFILNNSNIDKSNYRFKDLDFDDFNSKYYMKLVYLEEMALMVSQNSEPTKAEQAIRDAVAVHQYRESLLSDDAKSVLNGIEMIVSTPIYIGLATQQLSETDYRKRSQRVGCAPLSAIYGAESVVDCGLWSFQNFASAAYGHILDNKLTGGHWKSNVTRSFDSISRTAVRYYGLTDREAQDLTEKAMTNKDYQFKRISAVIEQVMTPYLNDLDKAKIELHNPENIQVDTDFDLGLLVLISGQFSEVYEDMFTLNSKQLLLHNIDYDFNAIESKLVFNHMPALIINMPFMVDDKEPFTEFYVSGEAELILDGTQYKARDIIAAQKDIQFHSSIVFDDKWFHYAAKTNGKIKVLNGHLRLEFEPMDEQINTLLSKMPKNKRQLINKLKSRYKILQPLFIYSNSE